MKSDNYAAKADVRIPIKRQLAIFVVAFVCLLAIATVIGFIMVEDTESDNALRSEIVSLNELFQYASPESAEAISQAQDSLRRASDAHDARSVYALLLVFVVALICLVSLSLYLYFSVVRPFAKLQGFAEEVASGNLDLPLKYERTNPFGKFAWAFDHMRSELKRARAAERAAIEENKSVIASLAHDLRTPVASIRTYSEALNIGLDASEEERREYAKVIERRCDEVSRLVDDMLTHSLTELDRISVECSPVSAALLVRQTVEDFGILKDVTVEVEEAVLIADELRLRQAIENLLINASKYAPSKEVRVTGRNLDQDFYRIEVRDFGFGMANEDIPFAFDRFYRGSNAGDTIGSGLGLYIVSYVVDQMGGNASIANAHPGIAVCLDIPLEA